MEFLGLERQLQPELDLARVIQLACYDAERCAAELTARLSVLNVVKHVEKLCCEEYPKSLVNHGIF